MSSWCEKDPDLAFKKGREWWIRLDMLAGRPGITLIDAYMLGSSRWILATKIARMSGIPTKTVNNWCRSRPGFAKRIGTDWYIDLEQMGATQDEVLSLGLGNPSQEPAEDREPVCRQKDPNAG